MQVLQSSAKANVKKQRIRVYVTTKLVLARIFLEVHWQCGEGSRRIGEVLAKFLASGSCRTLCLCARTLCFEEMDTRGAGEAARIGDRFLSETQRVLHGWLKGNLVEGLRSGIQTSIYTCDYTCKPSLTCGPVLKHLTQGMQRLEENMKMEAETAECQRLLATYPLPEAAAPASGTGAKQGGKAWQPQTPEQQEARRRLCRLWTAANHAVMHGHCLMAIQLLTGREVIRTHVFWRLMLKRVLWGIFEEMRRHRHVSENATEVEQQVALHDLAVPQVGQASAEAVELRTTSFYEDYLHRGEVEPLASMSFFTYGMHVSCVHIAKTGSNVFEEYDFASHYNKCKEYVQVLHPAPRIPYLHGVTCPSKAKDAEMWSAVHLALFSKHHCSDSKKCGQAEAVRHIRKLPLSRRRRVVRQGQVEGIQVDATGVLGEWKAREAEMQTLADRADATRLEKYLQERKWKSVGVQCCFSCQSTASLYFSAAEVKLRAAKRCQTVPWRRGGGCLR